MKETFVGNLEDLSLDELKAILRMNNINDISVSEIGAEVKVRNGVIDKKYWVKKKDV